MKKIMTALIVVLMLSSCSLPSYMHRGYRPIRSYSEKMEILKENYPEIYDLYRNGDVVLDKMYEYKKLDGTPMIHISYHYR